jgi:hypothetical protein
VENKGVRLQSQPYKDANMQKFFANNCYGFGWSSILGLTNQDAQIIF